jgi:hypothetical protein
MTMKWITDQGMNRDLRLPEFWENHMAVMTMPSALEFALGAGVYWPDIRGNSDDTREALGRILVWRQMRGWEPNEPEPSGFYEAVYRELTALAPKF